MRALPTPQALPAVEYPSEVEDWRLEAMVPDLLLWFLIAAYTVLTVRDIVKSVRMERKVGTSSQESPDLKPSASHQGKVPVSTQVSHVFANLSLGCRSTIASYLLSQTHVMISHPHWWSRTPSE